MIESFTSSLAHHFGPFRLQAFAVFSCIAILSPFYMLTTGDSQLVQMGVQTEVIIDVRDDD